MSWKSRKYLWNLSGDRSKDSIISLQSAFFTDSWLNVPTKAQMEKAT
jgi:hypothetical protein